MTTAYRVRRWNEQFENAQSRKVEKASWVPVPNKHDGKSFRRLMTLPNGPAIYGAWMLILQVASKCPNRGELIDEDGPLSAEDISLKTCVDESLIKDAITVLCSPKIGWLESFEYDGHSLAASELSGRWQSTPSTLLDPPTHPALNGTERNGRDRTDGTEKKERKRSSSLKSSAGKRSIITAADLFGGEIDLDDLVDRRRCDRLFVWVSDHGYLSDDVADRLRFHVLAAHVAKSESAKKPTALFRKLLVDALNGGEWHGANRLEDEVAAELKRLDKASQPANGSITAFAKRFAARVPKGVTDDE